MASTHAIMTTVLQMNNTKFKKGLTASQRALKGFQNQIKMVGASIAGAFAINSVIRFGKESVLALDRQLKAQTKVAQAIKSTGGTAGYAASQLEEMAKGLQKVTLFGDEDILANATAQLLTFTNITGKEFERTQQAVLDVATVLDQDLKTTAIQLGKALNDPVANLGALGRSGIQFSKSQKELIKSMWEVGNQAEAQRLILEELEKQYGGQAQAAAQVDVAFTQLQNRFGDFKETIGKGLRSALIRASDIIRQQFNPEAYLAEMATRGYNDAVRELTESMEELTAGMGTSSFFRKQEEDAEKARKKAEEVAAAMAKIPDVLPHVLPEGFDEAFGTMTKGADGKNKYTTGTVLQGLTWDREPQMATPSPVIDKTIEQLQAMAGLQSLMDETIAGWTEGMDEAFGAETFEKVEKVKTGFEGFGEMIGMSLVSQFDSLGEAIGKFASGAEDSFKGLGDAIMQNLGNILIMMGAQSGNLPLVLAGAAIQLGGGFLRGLGKNAPKMAGNTYAGGNNVNFRISGKDLVGVIDKQNYSNYMNT